GRCLGAGTQRCAAVRRPVRLAAHAVGSCRRPVSGPAVSRRPARRMGVSGADTGPGCGALPIASIPCRIIAWKPSWRIVPSRFPPIDLFERESLTNDRIREEIGDIALVPVEERASGPGATIVMAAFTHINRDGSRFADGSFGVFYAAHDLPTAVEETKHHRARFMRATAQPRMELDMRVYTVDLTGRLHDLRGMRETWPAIYHSADY